MESLAELIARVAQPGRVDWIGLRPDRRAAMQVVDRAGVGPDGLTGDHGASRKRAVTLMQAEHLAVVGAMLGQGPVAAEDLRRNILVAGINLAALKGRPLRLGGVVLRIVGPCAPCSRMEAALGPGGYSAMRGHGGWCAEVLEAGSVVRGDPVLPDD